MWAVVLVLCYLALVGAGVLLARGAEGSGFVTCPFRQITGYLCPGCGSTRMVLSAVRGQFTKAFLINPLMFVACAIGIVLLAVRIVFRRRVVWLTSAQSRRTFLVILVVFVAVNWLYLLATR